MHQTTSKYIQISDYLLLEYHYSGINEEYTSAEISTKRITNNIDGTYQFYNGDEGQTVTGNILDWSSSIYDTSSNKWALHETTGGKNLIGTEFYTIDDITTLADGVNYDTVKLHILSGFTFDGIDGLIVELKFKEASSKSFVVANYVYLYEEQINFNSTPLFLGEKYYNRYLEFKIPSLNFTSDEWLLGAKDNTTFAYNYSHPQNESNPNPAGYAKDSMIYVDVHEIGQINEETIDVSGSPDTRDVFMLKTQNTFSTSFNKADEYFLLAASIYESENGDYFEYFATWNGEFIDDYIDLLNTSTQGDWAIINELEVYEQIGQTTSSSSNFTMLQDERFDTPNLFRPIIVNADDAFSFSIDYTMRLFNKVSSEQIIRKSTITSYEPKKYGKSLLKIDVDEGFRPIKIYNKIANNVFDEKNDTVEPIYKTKYVKNYVQNFDISLNVDTTYGKGATDTIFGQGEAAIFLTPYDNILRFKVLVKSKDSLAPTNLNMEMSDILLGFENDIRIEADVVDGVDKTSGNLQFTISKEMSNKLLNTPENDFFIISKGNDLETVIYSGNYYDFADFAEVNGAILEKHKQGRTEDYDKYLKDYKNVSELNKILEKKLVAAESQKTRDKFEEIVNLQKEIKIKDQIIKDRTLKTEEPSIDPVPIIIPRNTWWNVTTTKQADADKNTKENVYDPLQNEEN